MPYTAPTPAELKARYPVFATVDDVIVQAAIDEAGRMVDETWTEGDYTNAIMLAACHIMALEGHGTSAEAKAVATGAGAYETIRSGQLTLTRGAWASGQSADGNWWKSTSWGRRFWQLLRLNKAGPRVVSAGCGAAVSGYAKDAFWPWVYR